jgi:F1F0 ATPase subunit 2
VRLALTSFFVRLALLSAGFIYIMDGDPLRLMACMTAFFIVRSIGVSPMNRRARES